MPFFSEKAIVAVEMKTQNLMKVWFTSNSRSEEKTMDHHEKHHEQHKKQREHEDRLKKEREHHQEALPRRIRHVWLFAIGVVLVILIVLIWTMI
jgi:hypothetical protein